LFTLPSKVCLIFVRRASVSRLEQYYIKTYYIFCVNKYCVSFNLFSLP